MRKATVVRGHVWLDLRLPVNDRPTQVQHWYDLRLPHLGLGFLAEGACADTLEPHLEVLCKPWVLINCSSRQKPPSQLQVSEGSSIS